MELHGTEQKDRIMQSKHKLRQVGGGRVFINQDLNKKESKMSKKRVREEREKGQNVKASFCKVFYGDGTRQPNLF